MEVHIALASDENYSAGLRVTAASIAEHASRDVELVFHVLDGGLSDSTWNRLVTLLNTLHPHVSAERLDVVSCVENLGFPEYHGSRMTYARLALPSILSTVEACIYCDVDFLWLADVAELWRQMRTDDVFLSVRESCVDTLEKEARWCRTEGVAFHPEKYVCAGLSFYNLKRAREVRLGEQAIEFLQKHASPPFVDQTAINAVLAGDVRLVDDKWECLTVSLRDGRPRDGAVLHFGGDTPWKLSASAAILTDAILLWHRCCARYEGLTLWQSLRRCLSPVGIVRTRLYWHIVRCPLTRPLFFAVLSALGRQGCRRIMEAKCGV